MRILYLHQYFNTPQGSGGIRSYAFAKRWVADGHTVRVLTSMGNDPSLTAFANGNEEGIQVEVLGGRYSATMSFYRRLFAFLLFSLHSCWRVFRLRHHFDICLATSTPLTIAIPALVWSICSKKPFVFEVRDVWPDTAIGAGVLKNRILIWLANTLANITYRKATNIVTLSDGMRDNLLQKGVSAGKLHMIPNSSDLDLFSPIEDKTELRTELGLPIDKCLIIHIGAVSIVNDTGFLSDLIIRMKENSNLHFIIVGDGNRMKLLNDAVHEHSLDNVSLLGRRPKRVVPKYLAASDIGLITIIEDPIFHDASPNKFFDYIATGLPPIFNRSTWLEPYMNDFNAGFVVPSHDINEYQQKITALASDPHSLRIQSLNCRKLSETLFSRDRLSANYLAILISSLNK